jgi:hypothetical protein
MSATVPSFGRKALLDAHRQSPVGPAQGDMHGIQSTVQGFGNLSTGQSPIVSQPQ